MGIDAVVSLGHPIDFVASAAITITIEVGHACNECGESDVGNFDAVLDTDATVVGNSNVACIVFGKSAVGSAVCCDVGVGLAMSTSRDNAFDNGVTSEWASCDTALWVAFDSE